MAFCQNCGAQLEESYKFCKVCGAKIAAQPEPENTPAEPQEAELFAQTEAELQDTAQLPAQELREAATARPSAEEPWQTQQTPVYPIDYLQQQKKSKNTGWIIALVVAAVLICTVVAGAVGFWLFGRSVNAIIAADDPNLGTYIGAKATMMGIDVSLKDILSDGFVIELKPGGVCRVNGGDKNSIGKWSLEGDVITLYDGETTLVGTLEDGVMMFENMMDLGIDVVFYKQDTDDEISMEPVNADTDWWNGEWYGWWMTSSCEGEYESWEGAWWDCCAEITMDENGQGHLLLWEEDYSKDDPLAEIDIVLTEEGGTMGTATTKSGYFIDQNVSNGEYVMDPSQNSYENLLSLKGWYETSDGGFYFEVYLRPWGQLWDDMIADDEGYAPYYYDKYVKAVENGESAPSDIYEAWGE